MARLAHFSPVRALMTLMLTLLPGASSLAATTVNNGNAWLVTLPNGTTTVVDAHELVVSTAGALVFNINVGQNVFVVKVIAPTAYTCVRAIRLASDVPGDTYAVSPPFPPGC